VEEKFGKPVFGYLARDSGSRRVTSMGYRISDRASED
jgi:hypothetical protein